MKRLWLLFGFLIPGLLGAQTFALPDSAPSGVQVGKSIIIRPIVKNTIGAKSSVARVQAVALDTAVLRITYATGGQRFTGLKEGVTTVRWQWDRTDGRRLAFDQTFAVVAAEAEGPPPVVDTVAPPTPIDTVFTVMAFSVLPPAASSIPVGDTIRMTVTSATITSTINGIKARPATAKELSELPFTWTSSNNVVGAAGEGPSVLVTGLRRGYGMVSVCAGNLCHQRVVAVFDNPAPPIPVDTVGAAPCRAMVASTYLRMEGDTALFVRALDGLPAFRYCVGNSLAVMLDGSPLLNAVGEEAFPAGAELPQDWPENPDQSAVPSSIKIVLPPKP